MSAGVLAGRLALVTGAASGIGAGCARTLAAAGADVALLVHEDRHDAHKLMADITALGRRATLAVAEVGDEHAVESAFDTVRDTLGIADILVNSAGLNMNGTAVADMDMDQWERLIRTDLTGSFLTARRFVRDRRGREGPATIVNITSIHAFAMRAGGADYTAAKGGQANLTRTMALECAAQGITVNAIASGFIATPMNAGEEEKAKREVPLGRAGTAEEVGRMVVYLASPDAAYVTGATLVIDGGLSLLMGQGA